ncbi:MAG: hypothetical protein LJE63_12585 [Desulfobacteraceae bacterium]|jgi:Fic family protein|nr:hypothetical protein [Desulfobacteraceae bacterium]
MKYQPPCTITPEILNRAAAISEAIGRLTVLTDQARALRLWRINRVRTIHGSLAIEGNTLSEAQINAILDGKRVIAPPREVQEVKTLWPLTTGSIPGSPKRKRTCWRRIGF